MRCSLAIWLSLLCHTALGQDAKTYNDSLVLSVEGTAEILSAGGTTWTSAQAGKVLHVGDRFRTGARSRAAIRLSDLSLLRVSELMTYEFAPPYKAGGKPVVDIKAGTAYFFSRDKPQEIQVRTPVATGAVRAPNSASQSWPMDRRNSPCSPVK